MTDPDKFWPSVTPQTWLPPLILCRMSTLLTAARFQSLDERFRAPSGRPFTKRRRTAILKRLRAAGLEHKGIPLSEAKGFNRDDALYAYRVVFPWGKAEAFNPTPRELKTALANGNFISISGNTKHTPSGSILRAHVNPVAHEIGLARLNKAGTRVLVYEPMRPDKPVWVPWEHVKAFASEFAAGGRYFAIRFPIAWATKEAAVRRYFKARLNNVKRARDEALAESERLTGELDRLTSDYDEMAAELGAVEQLLNEAQTELEECDNSWNDAIDAALYAVGILRRSDEE